MEIIFTIFTDATPLVLTNGSVDIFSRTRLDFFPTERINKLH